MTVVTVTYTQYDPPLKGTLVSHYFEDAVFFYFVFVWFLFLLFVKSVSAVHLEEGGGAVGLEGAVHSLGGGTVDAVEELELKVGLEELLDVVAGNLRSGNNGGVHDLDSAAASTVTRGELGVYKLGQGEEG